MSELKRSRTIAFDGAELALGEDAAGRHFRADARCFAGPRVRGAYAHVCASADSDARVPYDEPEVQQARADALAWWIPLLGDDLICLTTLSLDPVNCGGAITVARDPRRFADDPFARLFPGHVVRSDLFCEVPAPPGPVLERYAGAPWPAQGFPG